MNGQQNDLLLYYRFDEGFGNQTYDVSLQAGTFNKRDGKFFGDILWSAAGPDVNQLGIRATTNQFGDYTVDYIPYSSGGEIFKVTPTFGQHVYQPSSRTVFVGNGAQTQNGLDFTDISSFTVTGKVTYKNTNVPVKDVAILIDNNQAVGKDNKPVRTDAEGNYSIQVPIGYHYLSTEKNGHGFSEGFFPPINNFGQVELFEFTEDIIVNFIDSTLVKVAGRVVGGQIQANKKIGFHKSMNNVGVADLTFKLVNDAYGYADAKITTNAYSGEYSIQLIPEEFVIGDITTSNEYSFLSEDLGVLDLRNSTTATIVLDSNFNYQTNSLGDTVDAILDSVSSFTYHHLANFIVRSSPSVHVYQEGNDKLIGDTVLFFTNQETAEQDTLSIATNSPFRFPVFTMGKTYNVIVEVKEEYQNPYHPDGAIEDFVPVQGSELSISNQLSINPGVVTGKTNEKGLFETSFRAGIPDITKNDSLSFTKTFEVHALVSNISYSWRNAEDIYRAYVLGSSPIEGTGFVTYGPEIPEIILRDPPGTNSYAFIEKGSSYTTNSSFGMDQTVNSTLDHTVLSGIKYGVGGGLAGPLVENEFILTAQKGMGITKSTKQDGKYQESITFNERISTSSDPEDVGSDADVYIGRALNSYITQSKNLKPVSKAFAMANNLDYTENGSTDSLAIVLAIVDGYVSDNSETETYFIYSQKQIINEIVPTLFELRDNLFLQPEYTSHFPANNVHFGMNNNHASLKQLKEDTILVDPAADTATISYLFTPSFAGQIDSVSLLNQQIAVWFNTIAINEFEKSSAQTVRNISIDGSTGAFSSTIKQEFETAYNYQRVNQITAYASGVAGVLNAGGGFKLDYTFGLSGSLSTTDGEIRQNSIEFGYVIDERDEGDYYSIDVKHDPEAKYTDIDNFSASVISNKDWWKDQTDFLVVGGGAGGGKTALNAAVAAYVTKQAGKTTSRSNAYVSVAFFASDLAFQIMDLTDLYTYRESIHNDMDKNGKYDVLDFAISSPIFSVRGGQTKCPYEGEEKASFVIDANEDRVRLHTATLQREVPIIEVEPFERRNVPESETAKFDLILKNESESNSDMWYEIELLDETNPDGAILLIDGLTAERSFLVKANQALTKTLTVGKSTDDILEYDSIGIVLRSQCQYEPINTQANIADTVYVSIGFIPECSPAKVIGLQDNWVINYANNNKVNLGLGSYDINSSTLETVSLQYKTASGSPIAVTTYFKDTTSLEYQNFNGTKDLLKGGNVNFSWDLSSLSDRNYQVRAKTSCSDGSEFTSEYMSGVIDRINPSVFGTPEPADGTLAYGDDISIKFNEELEIGLIKDHNISLRGILNASDLFNSVYTGFNGVSQSAYISGVSLNNKSFTTEFWLKREAGSSGTVFSKGVSGEHLEMAFNSDETISLTVGTTIYSVNPQSVYSSVYPLDAWHHWGLAYDYKNKTLSFFMDDQILLSVIDVNYNSSQTERMFLAQDGDENNHMAFNMYELRIWEKALSVSESYAEMSTTLNGNEIGLYGYWPMNDGEGNLIVDKVRARNMNFAGDWVYYPESQAFNFNGTDQYLTLDGINTVINDETNFTIEFWVRGATPISDQTIFSNGKGDGTDTLAGGVLTTLNILATPNGNIIAKSNGNTFVLTSTNVFDNEWHHIALVVDRKSNVKSFVDGNLVQTANNGTLHGLAGSKFFLGARAAYTDPINFTIDQHFAGTIDEFRIWNSARTQELIETNKNSKLAGNEAGLLAYLPFENYTDVQGTIIRSTTLNDVVYSAFTTPASPALANSTAEFVDGASVSDIRPIQAIPFSFVVNTDEIVITPLIDANRIEGQTLEISVDGVKDLNGNVQLSAETWTAYVDKNQVVWDESTIAINHEVGSASKFSVNIINKGSTAYGFSLENLPNWLDASMKSGNIGANQSLKVNFTVNAGLAPGNYEQGINLKTSLGFDEKLTVKVNAQKPAPDYSVNTSLYDLNMSLFGRLQIGQLISNDTNDIVYAFVGSSCRGIAKVEYVPSISEYLVFLTMYSNHQNEEINFKVWDASEGNLHAEVTPQITFENNKIIGSSTNPQLIIASDNISSTITLNNGWTWVSFNLQSQNLSVTDSILRTLNDASGLVKNQQYFDAYDAVFGWQGSLTTLGNGFNVRDMYKLYQPSGGEITFSGQPVRPDSIQISVTKGWNFIGVTPQTTMTVSEAYSQLTPSAGDLVKGQTAFAMYDNLYGWIGSLKNIEPGKGYMLYSDLAKDFAYNTQSSLARYEAEEAGISLSDLPEELAHSYNPYHYPTNSTIVAKAQQKSLTQDDVLLAFHLDVLVGFAALNTQIDSVYFMTISANPQEEIHFKIYNKQTGKISIAENVITYEANENHGTAREPFPIYFEEEEVSKQEIDISIYPVPLEKSFNIEFTEVVNAQIKLINPLGTMVQSWNVTEQNNSLILNENIKSGAYILMIITNENTSIHEVIVQ